MAREVQPFLVEPTYKEINAANVDEFDTEVSEIEKAKDEIAKATESKNDHEKTLIDAFFGTKAKGSVTLSGTKRKVKVEYTNSVKSDLKELSEELPNGAFNLVFPPKREFSASAHAAYLKTLEQAALTNATKQKELEAYITAIAKYVHFNPTKPSMKIERID